MLAADLPRQARWSLTQAGFEDVLRELPAARDWPKAGPAVPSSIRGIEVLGVDRAADGAARFTLADGARPGGLTYLVDGEHSTTPPPGATFDQLRGNWYLWRQHG